MAREITVVRESAADYQKTRNVISNRTRNYSSADDIIAIARREQDLLKRYTGYQGTYQPREWLSEQEAVNQKRIRRAANRMIISKINN